MANQSFWRENKRGHRGPCHIKLSDTTGLCNLFGVFKARDIRRPFAIASALEPWYSLLLSHLNIIQGQPWLVSDEIRLACTVWINTYPQTPCKWNICHVPKESCVRGGFVLIETNRRKLKWSVQFRFKGFPHTTIPKCVCLWKAHRWSLEVVSTPPGLLSSPVRACVRTRQKSPRNADVLLAVKWTMLPHSGSPVHAV